MLPEIARAVGGRASILIDGGIRRGGDIAKALAMAPEVVHLGRACAYGVCRRLPCGVTRALEILGDEFDRTLALTGCPDPAALTADLIAPRERAATADPGYVLRTGRMTGAQKRALEELLPRHGIPYPPRRSTSTAYSAVPRHA